MFGDEGRDGLTEVPTVNHGPNVLCLHDAFVGVKHHHGREVPLHGDPDGIAVAVESA